MSEQMVSAVDWSLEQTQFRHFVRDMIHKAEKDGKVIVLPIEMQPGKSMIDLMSLLLAQVNCDGCDAPCCRYTPDDKPVGLLPPEYQRLVDKYGSQHFLWEDGLNALPMPCPFLKANRCTIYPDRPLVCVIYPFQPGSGVDGEGNLMLSVASSCPEAKRIARNVFMMAWRIRRQYSLLGEFNFLEGILK